MASDILRMVGSCHPVALLISIAIPCFLIDAGAVWFQRSEARSSDSTDEDYLPKAQR